MPLVPSVTDNLQKRYPEAPRHEIEAALEEADWHGGKAESILMKSDADWRKQQILRELKERIAYIKRDRKELKERLATEFDYEVTGALCEDLARVSSGQGETEEERLRAELKFLAASRNELHALVSKLYEERYPPDPNVCRMLGTVNGRSDFELKSGLCWSKDGQLEVLKGGH